MFTTSVPAPSFSSRPVPLVSSLIPVPLSVNVTPLATFSMPDSRFPSPCALPPVAPRMKPFVKVRFAVESNCAPPLSETAAVPRFEAEEMLMTLVLPPVIVVPPE